MQLLQVSLFIAVQLGDYVGWGILDLSHFLILRYLYGSLKILKSYYLILSVWKAGLIWFLNCFNYLFPLNLRYPYNSTYLSLTLLHTFFWSQVNEKSGGYINKLVVTCLRSGLNKPFRNMQKPERAPIRALRASSSGRLTTNLVLFVIEDHWLKIFSCTPLL